MKKIKVFSIMLLFLSSIIGLLPASVTVSAQEQIQVDVNVFLMVDGGQAVEQNQISYDIIQPNPEGGDGTVIYSYRSDNPTAEPLNLAAGSYRFRLFDGGNFYRDDQEIIPYGFEQTIATLTEEDIANNLQKRPLDPGQINTWADGTRVYDVAFSVAIGDNIYNSETGQYEVDLDFTLADPVSMSNEDNGQPTEEEPNPEETESVSSGLEVRVIDEAGSPLSNVRVTVNGEEYYTNESGLLALSDLSEGQEILLTVTPPEGYTGGGSAEPFIVEGNNLYEIPITLTEAPVSQGSVDFVVTDSNGQAIANVEIIINDQAIYTNEFGQASLANLDLASYTYQVTGLPEGYLPTNDGNITIEGDGLYTENIILERDIQYGSVDIRVLDENQNPIPWAEIVLNEQVYSTNAEGAAIIEELRVGESYTYSLASLPEGYDLASQPEAQTLEVLADETAQGIITVNLAQDEGTAEFIVKNEAGQGISAVTITVNGQTATTDESGRAVIANLPSGDYAYQLSNIEEAYQTPAEGYFSIQTETTTTQEITLVEELEYGNVSIAVRDENDQAIPGSQIEFNETVYPTNAEGIALVEGVQAGQTYTYSLASLPEDFQAETTPEAQTLEVLADETAQGIITVNLAQDEGTAEFIVKNEAGQGISAVTITVNGQTATTDESGRAVIANLPSGDYAYQLSNIEEAYQTPAEGYFSIQTETTTTQEITLVEELEYGNVSIAVRDENDQAIPGSQIEFNETVYPTNAEGIALIEGVQAGQTYTYSLASLPEDFQAETTPEAQTLEVLADETIQGIIQVIQAKEEGHAEFILQDNNSQPLVGLAITLNEQSVTTNEQGRALFENLAVGTYTYSISQLPENLSGNLEGQVTITRDETVQVTETFQEEPKYGELAFLVKDQEGQVVSATRITLEGTEYTANDSGEIIIQELPAGQVMNYSLGQLPEGYSGQESSTVTVPEEDRLLTEIIVQRDIAAGQITITVLDQNDQAVPSAQISLSNGQQASTNEAGQVQFTELEPATYEYELTSLPDNYTSDLEAQSINLTEGASEDRQVKVNRDIKPGSAIISLIDQEEKPVIGAIISINDQTYTSDDNGQITVADLAVGNYTYSVTELPEKYTGASSSELTITEGEETRVTLSVERIITPASASLTVVDQNGESVEGVVIAFGGLEGSSNSNGIVNLPELKPGNYQLSITTVPEAFNNNFEAKEITVEEGASIEETLTIERLPEVGSVRIAIVDNNNQPLANIEVELNGQTVKTDNQGYASFNDLVAGQSYEYKIVSLTEGYEMEGQTGQVSAIADETTTISLVAQTIPESFSESSESVEESDESESTSISVEESSSVTSEEQEEIDEAAQEATKQFVHADTGIEVWVNPADSANVVRLDVQKVNSLAGLENADAETYQIRLLNRENQAVALTRIAEVKIPTRPVNSQLSVVRINNDVISNLTFSLYNQRVTFRTQELGNFAVIYRTGTAASSEESESQTVRVNVESSVQESDNLPNTGERSIWVILVLAVALVAGGLGLIFYRKNTSSNEDESDRPENEDIDQ